METSDLNRLSDSELIALHNKVNREIAMRASLTGNRVVLNTKNLQDKAAKAFHISINDLVGPRQDDRICSIRYAIFCLANDGADPRPKRKVMELWGRHSTMWYSWEKKVKKLLEARDPLFLKFYNSLKCS